MKEKRNAKGEGSFKTNPDGTVTHRKSVGYKANGYRKILTVTAANKAACIKKMKKKEDAWNTKKAAGSIASGTTVAGLCEMHLLYQVEQDELKPKSIDRRECTIHKHIDAYPIGKMQLQAIKAANIDTFINELISARKLSASSIEKVLDVLHAAFQWGVIRGELEFNPVASVKLSLIKRIKKMRQKNADDADVKVLSEEEEKLFKAEAMKIDERTGKPKYVAGLYGMLLLHTGMRCGEMLALRWKDVDFDNDLLKIEKSRSVAKNRSPHPEDNRKFIIVEGTTKNEKARVIKLQPEATKILGMIKLYNGEDGAEDLIVKTRTGQPNTATNLEHRMATIFRNAGLTELTGSLHIFRRTFATRMYESGVRVKEIAAYIGDLESTTERYYIAVRKKMMAGGEKQQVVALPMTESKELDKEKQKVGNNRGTVRAPAHWFS